MVENRPTDEFWCFLRSLKESFVDEQTKARFVNELISGSYEIDDLIWAATRVYCRFGIDVFSLEPVPSGDRIKPIRSEILRKLVNATQLNEVLILDELGQMSFQDWVDDDLKKRFIGEIDPQIVWQVQP